MVNRKKIILGSIVIAVFLAFGMLSFKKTLTPYVSFAEARSSDRVVQVKGYPDHKNARFDPDYKAFLFTMKDDNGDDLKVVYRGPKPGNFEQAESVVAIGRYNGEVLESDQLLVKCPSKYESEYPGATSHPEDIPMRNGAKFDEAPATTDDGGAASGEGTGS